MTTHKASGIDPDLRTPLILVILAFLRHPFSTSELFTILRSPWEIQATFTMEKGLVSVGSIRYRLFFLSANTASRPKNVVLFGETGVGKSSIINLLAEHDVEDTSTGLQGCTLEAKVHSFSFPGPLQLNVFGTVGLAEPQMGVNSYFDAIKQAHELVKSLKSAGGVDLLVMCVRASRITSSVHRNYRLFSDILCGGEVPLAIVVTNLEQEKVMENWWIHSITVFQSYGIHSVAHACITALPAEIRLYAEKRAESLNVLRAMLLDALGSANSPYGWAERGWLNTIARQLRSFVVGGIMSLKKRDFAWRLKTECMFSRREAEQLAEVLTTL